jgi:hypothetical protein
VVLPLNHEINANSDSPWLNDEPACNPIPKDGKHGPVFAAYRLKRHHMTTTIQILIGVVFFIGAFILSQIIVGRRLRAIGARILKELSEQKALDAPSAVELAYAKADWMPKGLRDLRPKSLNDLVQSDIVGKTPEGRFYLRKQPHELKL